MFCAACGEKVVDTAVICPKCGSPVGKKKQEGEVSTALIVAGYITALLFPLIGFIIGIIVAVKGKVGHGVVQIAISLFWVIILFSMIFST
jgi:uncharacterized membrane protein YvbJ